MKEITNLEILLYLLLSTIFVSSLGAVLGQIIVRLLS